MRRFPRTPRLRSSTPRSVARNGRTLQDWVRLARRAPGAVPASVQRVIERRYPDVAREVGYV